MRQAIEQAAARLFYLPPYSPDLNPIELALSKLEWLLRSAAERTVEALCNCIGQLLDTILPSQCRNYLPLRLPRVTCVESALAYLEHLRTSFSMLVQYAHLD